MSATVLAITGAFTVCTGQSTTLSNTAGGGTWSSDNTAVATIGSSSGIVTGIATGTANITYSLGGGCEAMVTITVHPVPAAGTITGSASMCIGATVTLANSIPGGTWSASNANAAVNATGIVTGMAAGTAVISYTVSNAFCSAIATVNITVHPLPDAGVITGTATLCSGASTTLSETVSGGTWSSGNTAVATIGSSTGAVQAIATGTTVITYTVGPDANGCVNNATFSITVIPQPFTVSGNITPVSCYGSNNGSIAVTPTGSGYSYLWGGGDTTASMSGLAAGTFSVTVTAITTRCAATGTFVITEPDSLHIVTEIKKDNCKSGNGSISVTATGGTAPYTYAWAGNTGTTAEITALSTGTYTLSLTDANGCNKRFTAMVEDTTCLPIKINTGISPNGDGINDTWIIEGLFPYPMNTVQVFDKWGDIVYDRTHYQNDWNGTGKNGTLLPDGTYFYLLKLNDEHKTGGENVYKGTVMIKR